MSKRAALVAKYLILTGPIGWLGRWYGRVATAYLHDVLIDIGGEPITWRHLSPFAPPSRALGVPIGPGDSSDAY